MHSSLISKIHKANLYETNLDGALFDGTIMPDGTTQP